ncbi:hypothetical protein GpartN1_g6841.t1 [Galdieria partita]|uniref:Uncharacterized protein n=1 Tax=Galdieria partita TaxID=83374 RepID=A0A9C7Q2W0_9RHOD|nr:hypothetical protein GpartN1_g6841.t1 [Galdieria partita]
MSLKSQETHSALSVCTAEHFQMKHQEKDTIGENVIFVNGIAYNSRGFRVCGAPNQRGGFCARFGQCPFHKEKETTLQMNEDTVLELTQQTFTDKCVLLQSNGRKFKNAWKLDEHQRFLIALKKWGHGNWIQIADYVGTRSASQCQSHAQKYYLRKQKLASNASLKRSIFDWIDEDNLSFQTMEEDSPNVFKKCASKESQRFVRSRSKSSQRIFAESSVELHPQVSTVDSELSSLRTFQQTSFLIKIFRNGDFSHGAELELPNSLASFFIKAAQLLDMDMATKAYTRSGFEISSLHEVCPGDILWISSGEEFIFPSPVQYIET